MLSILNVFYQAVCKCSFIQLPPVLQPLGAPFPAVTILLLAIWEMELSSQSLLRSGTRSRMLPRERLAVAFSAACLCYQIVADCNVTGLCIAKELLFAGGCNES